MKKYVALLLIVVMTLSVCVGCGKKDSTSALNADSSENVGEDSDKNDSDKNDSDKNLTEDEKLFEQLFDINTKVSISIDISDEELNKIQEDFVYYDSRNSKSPIYRMADKVTFTVGDKSYEIEEVGIRLKGNMSRNPIYDIESGEPCIYSFRLSFDETFDDETHYKDDALEWSSDEARKERKDRTFATLSAMEVKWNSSLDDTNVRDYYALEMFRENGALAQHTNLSQIVMQGKNFGVFKIYEPIDKTFIEKNIPEEDQGGDLYKCGWTFKPANYSNAITYGVEDPDTNQVYNYDLKTNKSSSENDNLSRLISVLNSGDVTKEDFESVVDEDSLAKFLAISYFVGNPDDMRNNYNNHYVYFLKSTGKAVFITYDNDRCFGITYKWNPDTTGMTAVSPFSEDAEGNGSRQSNPVIKYGIFEDGFIRDKYITELKKIADSDWMTMERFNKIYETAKANYEDVVSPEIDFAEVDESKFYFGLDGEFRPDDEGNIAIDDYFNRLMTSYNKAMEENEK